MASSIKAAKGLLRKEMKSVLKSLSEFDKIRQSDQIIEKLLKDPRYMAAETVGVYLNMPDEVKTTNLLTLLPLVYTYIYIYIYIHIYIIDYEAPFLVD